MTRWKIATIVFATLFVSTMGLNVVQRANAERRQPHMEAALGHLQRALGDLESAEHDKGGWRKAAIGATRTAIRETERGLRFDEHHEEHRR